MRTVSLLPLAKADLREIAHELNRRSLGWGTLFLRQAATVVAGLALTAGAHRKLHRHHRVIVPKFSHLLFYRMEADAVLIVAVVDGRRDPTWIRGHLPPLPR